MTHLQTERPFARDLEIQLSRVKLGGRLELPNGALGVVVFAHGSGSSRHSPRNRFVARRLQRLRMGTLLFDLLTEREEAAERLTGHLRFDVGLLAERLVGASAWLSRRPDVQGLPLGFFGASTGAAAALLAAAHTPRVSAVVSRGGRPDLAGAALEQVTVPTLFIVGGLDQQVLELNRVAFERLRGVKAMRVIEGASHLFEEPGKLDEAADLAAEWFKRHFT